MMLAWLEPAEAEPLEQSLRLLDLPPIWVVVLVILPLFGLLTWIGYGREALGNRMRGALMALRVLAFLLLSFVLARPVRVEQRVEIQPAEVLVLLDDSASMRQEDTYADAADQAALQRLAGGTPGDRSRLELVRRMLEIDLDPVFRAGGYETRLIAFAEGTSEIPGASALAGRGAGTHLGSALAQTIAGHRGRNVTDVLVISDGRSNGGLDVEEAATAALSAGIPVHTVTVGDTRPERNAILELVEAPAEALAGDELAVTVRVLARGPLAGEVAELVLEELDQAGEVIRPLAEERATLTEEGERVVLLARGSDSLTTGERRFRVLLPEHAGETRTEDNEVTFTVTVSPSRMRVLYVDGYPRWEYRYLKNLLLRADENIDVQCFLLSATPDFPQESSPTMQPLRRVPTTRKELLDSYDVVILGDVDPSRVSFSESEVEDFLLALRQFVEAGGGLLFQAGEYHNPRSYLNTALEDVLPVVLDPTGVMTFDGDTAREFRATLEQPTNPHEILRLHPDPDVNRRLWEDPGEGLRGFYWYYPVDKAKAGTQTLLHHPTDLSPHTGEPYPLLVTGYYPSGRTLFLAVDSTWMWRYHYGDRYHEAFWRNAIRWLALGRLKSGDRRFRLESSRSVYDLDDRILLEARVLDEDFRPEQDRVTQTVHWSDPDGRTEELELARAPEREGTFRGGLLVGRPGLYKAWIEENGKRVSQTEFEVVLPSRETSDPTPDPVLMRRLAEKTGGRATTLARVGELFEEFSGDEERREPVSSRLEDAWDNWATLLCALGLLSAEWILRKKVELV